MTTNIRIKKLLLTNFILSFVFSSCEFEVARTYDFNTPSLGPIEVDSVGEFENLFLVTEDKCNLWDKPNTRFIIEYPDSIQVDTAKFAGSEKYYYVNFKLVNRDTILEELTIGSLTSIKELDLFMGKKLAEERVHQLNNDDADYEVLLSQVDSFYGQNNFMFITDVELKGNQNGYNGRYLNLEVSYYPNVKNKNPIRIVWTKNKSICEQGKLVFDNHSLMGKVWDTFSFIE